MALDAEQMEFLRQLISEPSDENGWTDERIQALGPGALAPDGSYDMRAYAAAVWEAKAAEAVSLVDVSEAGSSRSMGQIFGHAAKMAERYRAPADQAGEASAGRTRIGRIVRE